MSPHDQSHLLRPPPTRGPIAPFYVVFFSYIYIAVKQACHVLTGEKTPYSCNKCIANVYTLVFSHGCKDLVLQQKITQFVLFSYLFFYGPQNEAMIGQP